MRTVELTEKSVRLIDQKILPTELKIIDCPDYLQVAEAIRDLTVRGAPAIGVAAAGGIVLAAEANRNLPRDQFLEAVEEAAKVLRGTRPTAVNLFWAINRMMRTLEANKALEPAEIAVALRREAYTMADEDVEVNRRMGAHGAELVADGNGILTHCNAGSLATVEYGTAIGVIRASHEQGKKIHVFVDETRPVLQGARLTAWEMVVAGIPATLITDNMAAHFMRLGKIQIVFVGADRVAANGDAANKIGTYSVSILAREHGIPFYVVVPTSTIDPAIASGDEIVIEERRPEEVTHIGGRRIAPEGIGVANPAFDVTPHRYITGIITEHGVAYPPYEVSLKRMLEAGQRAT